MSRENPVSVVFELRHGKPYEDQLAVLGLPTTVIYRIDEDTSHEKGLALYTSHHREGENKHKCVMITDKDYPNSRELEDDQILAIVHSPVCRMNIWLNQEIWRSRMGMARTLVDYCPHEIMPTLSLQNFKPARAWREDMQHRTGELQ